MDDSNQENKVGKDMTRPSSPPSQVIAACRKSVLALVQARAITAQLSRSLPSPPSFDVVTRNVAGDADKQTPFLLLSKQAGGSDVGKSLWTTGLEEELVAGEVDFLVHCLKDMPTTLPAECLLGAIPEREDASDAVVMRAGSGFTAIDQLPPGSVVGSSSSRRRALIQRNWPQLKVAECRGNLDTRLAKLDAPDSPFSCILLASAGLLRLDLGHRITQRLDPGVFPYAVGQGALGIEVKTGREEMLQFVCAVDHKPSRWRGFAERAMVRTLQGGCSSPIGVWSSFEPAEVQGGEGGRLQLRATVLNVQGSTSIYAEDSARVAGDDEAEQLGVLVARALIDKGASRLLSR